MKKIILSMILSLAAISAYANKENITIVYSWNVGDTAINFYRALADQANRAQNKYNFIVEARPGAGGSIAAKHVASNPTNTVLANSSALFIRPVVYPTESHSISSFKSLMPMCVGPLFVSSMKYKNWNEVPKDKPLTIGVSGLGTTTYLVATQIASRYPNMTVIGFKATSEAVLSVLGGQTDFAVNFYGDTEQWQQPDKSGRQLFLLGVTGKTSSKGVPTFASQGFPGNMSNMSSPQQLFTAVDMPDQKFWEIRRIFVTAANSPEVKAANAQDHCIPNNQLPDNQLVSWFADQTAFWNRVASSVSLPK